MGNVIGAIVLGVVAIGCFVVSYLQFHEIGFLFMLQNKNERIWIKNHIIDSRR